MPQKLHAFELFLSKHPDWVGKLVLVQVAVPTRQDVEEYQNLRAVVNELVGRIHGRYGMPFYCSHLCLNADWYTNSGTVEYMPIHFMHKSLPFEELISLYAVSDACLVTSTRDGMNLVSYECIGSQQDKQGVLMLSEFTGAAESLNGSLVFNPWNTKTVADTIHGAVNMCHEERTANSQKLKHYVMKYTSAFWGQSFVTELSRISEQIDNSTGRR